MGTNVYLCLQLSSFQIPNGVQHGQLLVLRGKGALRSIFILHFASIRLTPGLVFTLLNLGRASKAWFSYQPWKSVRALSDSFTHVSYLMIAETICMNIACMHVIYLKISLVRFFRIFYLPNEEINLILSTIFPLS